MQWGCFIMMPFKGSFTPVYEIIRDKVILPAGGQAIRGDDISLPGTVISQVKEAIQEADFCIADITGNNPNVMWESGYAHALGKQVIVL